MSISVTGTRQLLLQKLTYYLVFVLLICYTGVNNMSVPSELGQKALNKGRPRDVKKKIHPSYPTSGARNNRDDQNLHNRIKNYNTNYKTKKKKKQLSYAKFMQNRRFVNTDYLRKMFEYDPVEIPPWNGLNCGRTELTRNPYGACVRAWDKLDLYGGCDDDTSAMYNGHGIAIMTCTRERLGTDGANSVSV